MIRLIRSIFRWRLPITIRGRRIVVPIVATVLLMCCGGTFVASLFDQSAPTPSSTIAPYVTRTPVPATATSRPPTATKIPPTATPEPQTATPEPPTATPVPPAPTATIPVRAAPAIAVPTARGLPSAVGSSCDCSGNIYNCDDFPDSWDAQACYMRCKDITGADVHRLDADKDGTACEWEY